jgi:integrase/DNA-binding XRE family transcriptional regulator
MARRSSQSVDCVDLARLYLDARDFAPSTLKGYRYAIEILGRAGADLPLGQATPTAVQRVYDTLAERHGHGMATRSLKLVKAAWSWAARRELAPAHNPWGTVEKPRYRPRPLYFEPGWLPHVIALVDELVVDGTVAPHAGRFLALALATGARPWCEVLELRVDDLDWAAEQIVIRKGKGRRPRTIPMQILGSVGLQVLQAQAELVGSGWLWPARRGPGRMSGTPARLAWPRVLDRAEAVGLRTKTLEGRRLDIYSAGRHAVAHFAVCQLGLSIGHVAAILGHRSEETMRTYAHLSSKHAAPTAAKIGQAYDEARTCTGGAYGFDPAALRAARQQAGLTQQQLGAAISVTKQAISNWERGTNPPSVAELHRLAVLLGRPVDSLLARPPRRTA